jgi:hypothetical protein
VKSRQLHDDFSVRVSRECSGSINALAFNLSFNEHIVVARYTEDAGHPRVEVVCG